MYNVMLLHEFIYCNLQFRAEVDTNNTKFANFIFENNKLIQTPYKNIRMKIYYMEYYYTRKKLYEISL